MKSPRLFNVLGVLLFLATSTLLATQNPVGIPPASIQAVINATALGDTVNLSAGTYNQAVVISQSLVLRGNVGGSTITPPSGSGITITGSHVTIQDLTVTGAPGNGISANGGSSLRLVNVHANRNTGSGAHLTNVATVNVLYSTFSNNTDEGFNTLGGSAYTITGVTANGNGSGANGSGLNIKGVAGPSLLTSTIASNNHVHGLSIGDGATSVTVNAGTFNSNGQSGNAATGGGINIVAQGTKTTSNVAVEGVVDASNNMSAGVYVFAASNSDSVNTVNIGDGSSSFTVTNNGSGGGTPGGAGVVVVGKVTGAVINKLVFTKGAAPGDGVMVLINGSGNSPSGTNIANSTFTGYDSTHPVITLTDGQGHGSANPVRADSGNSFLDANDPFQFPFQVEDLIYHKLDNAALGLVTVYPGVLFVTAKSGSIQRGIDAFPSLTDGGVAIGPGTYLEAVTLNKGIEIRGSGATTIVKNTSGHGITVTAGNQIFQAHIQDLKVTQCSGNGITANGISYLNLTNVSSDSNNGSGAQLNSCSYVTVTLGSYSGNLHEGFNTLGGDHYTMTNVVASGNGSGTNGSGVNLKGITAAGGTSVVTNLTASNNHLHGLSVGDGAAGVTISGGTFTGNGTIGNATTGGGINFIASGGTTTSGITLNGIVNSSNNTTAGIYIFSDNATVNAINTVSIGATGSITLSNNGSSNITYSGGAGVLIYGIVSAVHVANTTFTKGAASGSGLMNLGNGTVGGSPTGTQVANSSFNGYTSARPAVTLTDGNGHTSPNDVAATNNTFTFPVAAKVFLQGPYSAGAMTNTLATSHLIPVTQPYTVTPWSYAGSESPADTNVFVSQGVTDWVLVELRSTFNGAAVSRRAALLKDNGTILDTNGTSVVACTQVLASGYTIRDYIVIKHRNHLAIMTNDSISVPNEAAAYDFTADSAKLWGHASTPGATKNLTGLPTGSGGIYGMWAGDFNGDGVLKYNANPNSDRAGVLSVLSGFLSVSPFGYWNQDMNLDGKVRYNANPGSDRAVILDNVTGFLATSTKTRVP